MARYTNSFRCGEWYIWERGGWYYRARIVNGKREQVALGVKCFEQAKQALTDWYISSRVVKGDGALLCDVLRRYWENHAIKTPTGRVIKGQLKYWYNFHGTDTVAVGCSYARLNEFREWLVEQGLAASTINHTLMIGRAACRMAWKRGELPSVPHFQMNKVGNQPPMGRPLTVDEMRRVVAEADGHMRTLVLFLIGTGARPTAILELDWSQVQDGLIYLNPVGRTQNKKHRPTVRCPAALEALRGDGPVIQHKGKPVASVANAWRKLRTRAGLDGTANLYSFRHSLGRWLRKEGVSLESIQLQLGHRKEGVTSRYVGFAPDYLDDVEAAVDKLLGQILDTGKVKTQQIRRENGLEQQLGKLTNPSNINGQEDAS
jgi:integrase